MSWSDFENLPPTAIQEPPSEDGAYKGVFMVGDPPEEGKKGVMCSIVISEGQFSNHSVIKFMLLPSVMAAEGKLGGYRMAMQGFKAAAISTGTVKAVAKVKGEDQASEIERLGLMDNKTCYIYFVPAELVRKNTGYPEVHFIDKDTFEAKQAANGSRMAAYRASIADVAKPEASSLKDLLED